MSTARNTVTIQVFYRLPCKLLMVFLLFFGPVLQSSEIIDTLTSSKNERIDSSTDEIMSAIEEQLAHIDKYPEIDRQIIPLAIDHLYAPLILSYREFNIDGYSLKVFEPDRSQIGIYYIYREYQKVVHGVELDPALVADFSIDVNSAKPSQENLQIVATLKEFLDNPDNIFLKKYRKEIAKLFGDYFSGLKPDAAGFLKKSQLEMLKQSSFYHLSKDSESVAALQVRSAEFVHSFESKKPVSVDTIVSTYDNPGKVCNVRACSGDVVKYFDEFVANSQNSLAAALANSQDRGMTFLDQENPRSELLFDRTTNFEADLIGRVVAVEGLKGGRWRHYALGKVSNPGSFFLNPKYAANKLIDPLLAAIAQRSLVADLIPSEVASSQVWGEKEKARARKYLDIPHVLQFAVAAGVKSVLYRRRYGFHQMKAPRTKANDYRGTPLSDEQLAKDRRKMEHGMKVLGGDPVMMYTTPFQLLNRILKRDAANVVPYFYTLAGIPLPICDFIHSLHPDSKR